MKSFRWEGSSEDSPAVAVLLPGSGYTVQGPLLYWCAALLVEQGWRVYGVDWEMTELTATESTAFVEAAARTTFEDAGGATTRLVIGKSFGTRALGWAVRNDVPGVWLTPVLTDPDVASALDEAGDGHLAVGGDLDELWVPTAAPNSRAELITVAGADHSLQIGTDWRASVGAQIEVHEAVDRHIRTLAQRTP